MRIAIVGGKLQGIEGVNLAAKAGFQVVLLDRDPLAPALPLVDESHCLDLLKDRRRADELLTDVDAILPATENRETLAYLAAEQRRWGVPLLYDAKAHEISRNKVESNNLFRAWAVPTPLPWPESGFPVVVKPANLSGSVGVERANTRDELDGSLRRVQGMDREVVVQQFVDGPSLSVEVIAQRGQAQAFLVTELEFDAGYDCKRVIAPATQPMAVQATLRAIAERLAQSLSLTGIMDLEVMVDGDVPRVIEIDARLPSQTPTAVYWASGANMLKVLTEMFVGGSLPKSPLGPPQSVIYEHVQVRDGAMWVKGEHVMLEAGKLRIVPGFFGAAEAITDFFASQDRWVATLVFRGVDAEEVQAQRELARQRMVNDLRLRGIFESVPGGERAAG